MLPFGACESHGAHLPLGTDSFVTQKVAEEIAKAFNGYLLPLFPFGTSEEHIKFRGTVSLRHSTLAAVLQDIVESLEKTGFRKLIIVSFHGGNYILSSDFLKILQSRHPSLQIVFCEIRDAWRAALKNASIETKDLHAGEVETSLILALRPELVKESVGDFPVTDESFKNIAVDHTGFPCDVSSVSERGVLGCPSKASRQKGELFFAKLLEILIAQLKVSI
ncbi:MAG: creatininase family protein [Planctomycetota bacterium]|nr:creatininase family protein [Planctomycetota bacterium]